MLKLPAETLQAIVEMSKLKPVEMPKCRNSFDMSKLSKPKNITFYLIARHPMIVKRCIIARWNRLITASRMVAKSSFCDHRMPRY